MVRRCLRCPSGRALTDGSCGTCAFPFYFDNTSRQCECIEDLNTPVDCYDSTTDKEFLFEALRVNITDDENVSFVTRI